MRLIDDWRRVIKRAWSIRLLIVAGILSGIEVALPVIDGWITIPRGLFASLSFVVVAAAFVARIVAQKGVSDE
jgi:hypothetical protein